MIDCLELNAKEGPEGRIPNRGNFTIAYHGGQQIKIELNDFYIKDGFVVFEHIGGQTEYVPESKIDYIATI